MRKMVRFAQLCGYRTEPLPTPTHEQVALSIPQLDLGKSLILPGEPGAGLALGRCNEELSVKCLSLASRK